MPHDAKNKIVGRIIPFLVPGFWIKKHHGMQRCHAISPGFPGHYQDLELSGGKWDNSDYNFILAGRLVELGKWGMALPV